MVQLGMLVFACFFIIALNIQGPASLVFAGVAVAFPPLLKWLVPDTTNKKHIPSEPDKK
jgi:hypothetical protein